MQAATHPTPSCRTTRHPTLPPSCYPPLLPLLPLLLVAPLLVVALLVVPVLRRLWRPPTPAHPSQRWWLQSWRAWPLALGCCKRHLTILCMAGQVVAVLLPQPLRLLPPPYPQ